MVLDFRGGRLGLRIIPGGVFVIHAVHFDVVIVSGPLPGADCRMFARFQEFLYDSVQRK